MSEKGSRNEGVRVIAVFDDRAVPLSAEAVVTSDRPGRSANEGIRVVTTIDTPAVPAGDESPPAAGTGIRPWGPAGWVGRLSSWRTLLRAVAAAALIAVCLLLAVVDFSPTPGVEVGPVQGGVKKSGKAKIADDEPPLPPLRGPE